MAERAKDQMENAELREKVEKNLGKPVLALLELPTSPEEQRTIEALGLKEGDILASLDIGGIHAHTWSCAVSLPPDCSVDIDG